MDDERFVRLQFIIEVLSNGGASPFGQCALAREADSEGYGAALALELSAVNSIRPETSERGPEMSETKPDLNTTTEPASTNPAVDRRQLIRISAAGAGAVALGGVTPHEGVAQTATPEASPDATAGASPVVALPDLPVDR